jgi:amino acid transporter
MTTPQDPFGPPGDNQPTSGGGGAGGPGAAPGQQQQYGQQQYGAPPGHSGPKSNGLGIAALVVGLLALLGTLIIVGGIVLGIAAIVLGFLGRSKVKRGEADNGGMAIAGLVLGAVALVLSVVFLAVGVAFFQSSGGGDLVECVQQAQGDQAAIDACEREFQEGLQ